MPSDSGSSLLGLPHVILGVELSTWLEQFQPCGPTSSSLIMTKCIFCDLLMAATFSLLVICQRKFYA